MCSIMHTTGQLDTLHSTPSIHIDFIFCILIHLHYHLRLEHTTDMTSTNDMTYTVQLTQPTDMTATTVTTDTTNMITPRPTQFSMAM